MALFFDGAWFDERLARLGLSRATLAAALGLDEGELALVWKDQRELSARDVSIMAALLGAEPAIVADHAGISTPVPKNEPSPGEIVERLARIEAKLDQLTALLRAKA